ncbi:hypothetical protein D083_1465 [Dickeya solani RNS 08.23.3.1.A]|nr:hypothetical protein D083_1465 [Dickeya solani RNS 08.23.3.1.A]
MSPVYASLIIGLERVDQTCSGQKYGCGFGVLCRSGRVWLGMCGGRHSRMARRWDDCAATGESHP